MNLVILTFIIFIVTLLFVYNNSSKKDHYDFNYFDENRDNVNSTNVNRSYENGDEGDPFFWGEFRD